MLGSFDHPLSSLKHVTLLIIAPQNVSKPLPFCFTTGRVNSPLSFSLLILFLPYLSLFFFPFPLFPYLICFSLTLLLISPFWPSTNLLVGMLKMKIQAMCWVNSLKVAISKVKHKSGKIIGLAHPARVPTPTPIYWGKCARGQKFRFLNSTSNHIMRPLIWKFMLHWFQKCAFHHEHCYIILYVGWKTTLAKKIKS